MVIGIDIDNTITHTTETIMHYAFRIFGEQRGLLLHPTQRYYYLEDTPADKAVAEEFLSHYLGCIYRYMPPKEQAVEVIQELKREHEIILITSRNRQYPEVEKITREWMDLNGIAYDRADPQRHREYALFQQTGGLSAKPGRSHD